MRKSIAAILFIMVAMFFGLTDALATSTVEPGQSIQSAINAASSGQIIVVQNGTYHENINVTKTLTLKGVGSPVIDAGGNGCAITISANDSNLLGFTATGGGIDSLDAGIKVLSNGNTIRGNTVLKNSNYGIILYHADENAVFWNDVKDNQNSGILLIHSNDNQVWGNYASMNRIGITIQTSKSNTINGNNLTRNKIGINISNFNFMESVKTQGKGVSIVYKPSSQLAPYNIDKNSTGVSAVPNILYQNNLLDNDQDAYDDGNNQWNNEKSGNYYSNYDSREEGCRDRNRDRICDLGHSISGGGNVDNLPQASSDAILGYKSQGVGGYELKTEQRTFLPGEEIDVRYLVPANFSGWLGIMKTDLPRGEASKLDALSSVNLAGISGMSRIPAPAENGSYDIRMYDTAGGVEMASLNFGVSIPTISATPDSVYSCEQMTVRYAGAPGFENDWIAMYRSGDPDTTPITRQYLDGNENGTVVLTASNPGSYDFRIFKNDTFNRLAVSNTVTANAYKGTKIVVSPNHVAPSGTVTVTYWGAPASGTGIIGMYGVNRPDKFPEEKRSIGGNNCGSMTWRLPSMPGQYDFRMFYSDITGEGQGAYQLLGQTSGVTVG
jgi:parallel beta-helix repeat protein